MQTSGSVLIDARNLRKTYRMGTPAQLRAGDGQTVHALRDVSLQITEGEFVAIMGASGSGKSTLMNILGCLDLPTEGSYHLAGEAVQGMGADQLASIRNRRIGFVFQQFNLLPRTSALENVELPMVYGNVDGPTRKTRARAALQRVGLGERLDHTPAELSGGQQQRVAIARALVNSPQLILADEPTGALDSQTSEDIMRLLTELNQQGMTVVLVTHEADIAAWARRRLVFKDGHIVEDVLQPVHVDSHSVRVEPSTVQADASPDANSVRPELVEGLRQAQSERGNQAQPDRDGVQGARREVGA
ncbi:ABC transporter ATP-binding protein [Rhodoferax saidenbachensis]|uniref:Macrolide ABC transporter ATP-binding protein n=1 Tax=Rhodoferax saidenbachensis TaxID=1484693 RepID=A0A1P8KC52_9BURK|nr:ABC transporter ATP-binding protein [Rhodoferax saidenbachensis]APW43581.1 macrolide ABC transporter ATP-binding protein [Rhodoferax saidenbachensis]